MARDAMADGLAGSLLGVVADPARTGALYEILGEYCHQLRNRLSCMRMSFYLASGSAGAAAAPAAHGGEWVDLERQYREVEGFVEQVQVICRPMRLTPVRLGLHAVIEDRLPTWSAWLAERGRSLELLAPRRAAVGCFDPTRLTQGLDALAYWRSRTGPDGCPVRLRWWAEKNELRLSWHEPDAPSLCAAESSASLPSALALPILGRVVATHGGSFSIASRAGLRFNLRWPREMAAAPAAAGRAAC